MAQKQPRRGRDAKTGAEPQKAPPLSAETLDRVARVVHEAVRAWARGHGDASLPAWDDAEAWMVESTREAIRFRLDNPDAPASAQHDQWMAERLSNGWTYGGIKDPEKKTHPMLVAYDLLPAYERRKDALVGAVISSLTGSV